MLDYKKIKGNLIHKSAIINWKKLNIGKNNIIGPYVVIGNIAQHPKSKSSGKIIIGSNNIINEYCNIHLPTKIKKITFIGDDNFIMNSTTVDHDCTIENNVTISSGVILGGNVYLMKGSQLGMRVSVHQNQIIGSYSMIGMNSFVTKKTKILPGFTYFGKPAKKIKKNILGLKRNKINKNKLDIEFARYQKIFKNL
tara:strand:+ start:227 stop:814 length:588 start_codon:yes stop_codon:yes gene_type:complete